MTKLILGVLAMVCAGMLAGVIPVDAQADKVLICHYPVMTATNGSRAKRSSCAKRQAATPSRYPDTRVMPMASASGA